MILLEYDRVAGLGLVLTGRARCGQIEAKQMALPEPSVEPPIRADVVRDPGGGIALVDIRRIDEGSIVLRHWGEAIEGEARGGVLRGVACDEAVEIKIPRIYEGPLMALVPVAKIGRLPKAAFRLITYQLAVP